MRRTCSPTCSRMPGIARTAASARRSRPRPRGSTRSGRRSAASMARTGTGISCVCVPRSRTMRRFEWHLLLEPRGAGGPENMARDEALLTEADRTGAAFLRLYRFDPPCLSLGRNEPAPERLGFVTVRRPTGGRSVWHEHEVTYAVAAPIAAFGRLRDAYRAIHERLATALRSLGADVTISEYRPIPRLPDRPTDCFAATVGGEVLVAGRKVIGSAQIRRGASFLQHGSILLDGSPDVVNATTLRAILGRTVTFEEVAAAIVRTWGEPLTNATRCRPMPSCLQLDLAPLGDRKSTRLNSSHLGISYAVFCLKKKQQPYVTATYLAL